MNLGGLVLHLDETYRVRNLCVHACNNTRGILPVQRPCRVKWRAAVIGTPEAVEEVYRVLHPAELPVFMEDKLSFEGARRFTPSLERMRRHWAESSMFGQGGSLAKFEHD